MSLIVLDSLFCKKIIHFTSNLRFITIFHQARDNKYGCQYGFQDGGQLDEKVLPPTSQPPLELWVHLIGIMGAALFGSAPSIELWVRL